MINLLSLKLFAAITGFAGVFKILEIGTGSKGKVNFTDSRGKFAPAYGEVDLSGYFNVADTNDAEYNAKGWIDY